MGRDIEDILDVDKGDTPYEIHLASSVFDQAVDRIVAATWCTRPQAIRVVRAFAISAATVGLHIIATQSSDKALRSMLQEKSS